MPGMFFLLTEQNKNAQKISNRKKYLFKFNSFCIEVLQNVG